MILKLTPELAHQKARAEFFQTAKDQQQHQCFTYEAELFVLRTCLDAATDKIQQAEMKVTKAQRYIQEKSRSAGQLKEKTRTNVRNLLTLTCLPWQSLKHLLQSNTYSTPGSDSFTPRKRTKEFIRRCRHNPRVVSPRINIWK